MSGPIKNFFIDTFNKVRGRPGAREMMDEAQEQGFVLTEDALTTEFMSRNDETKVFAGGAIAAATGAWLFTPFGLLVCLPAAGYAGYRLYKAAKDPEGQARHQAKKTLQHYGKGRNRLPND